MIITCIITLKILIGGNMYYTPKYIPCEVLGKDKGLYSLQCESTIKYLNLNEIHNYPIKYVDVSSCNPDTFNRNTVNGKIFNKLIDKYISK